MQEEDVGALVMSLLAADALPGSGFSYVLRRDRDEFALESAILYALLELGMVQRLRDGDDYSSWELTKQALAALRPELILSCPQPALQCRPGLDVKSLTTWELLKALEGAGWQPHVLAEGADRPPPITSESAKICS